jgi:hypothetical protein
VAADGQKSRLFDHVDALEHLRNLLREEHGHVVVL